MIIDSVTCKRLTEVIVLDSFDFRSADYFAADSKHPGVTAPTASANCNGTGVSSRFLNLFDFICLTPRS